MKEMANLPNRDEGWIAARQAEVLLEFLRPKVEAILAHPSVTSKRLLQGQARAPVTWLVAHASPEFLAKGRTRDSEGTDSLDRSPYVHLGRVELGAAPDPRSGLEEEEDLRPGPFAMAIERAMRSQHPPRTERTPADL